MRTPLCIFWRQHFLYNCAGTIFDLWTPKILKHWLIRWKKCKANFANTKLTVLIVYRSLTVSCFLWHLTQNGGYMPHKRFYLSIFHVQVLEPCWCVCWWCWTCCSSLTLFEVLAQGTCSCMSCVVCDVSVWHHPFSCISLGSIELIGNTTSAVVI